MKVLRKWPRQRPAAPTEAQLHRAVAQFLRVALKPPTIWTTIGHGGGGRVRGAQLKAMGVQKGWPDILIVRPLGTRRIDAQVVGIELKAAKGQASAEQKIFKTDFEQANGWYVLCRSVESVETALRCLGVPLHATTMRAAA